MQSLEALTREAAALGEGRTVAQPPSSLGADQAEVARLLHICNACRYCEGFCAVFPAMTRRLEFGKADVDYLANLCHNCGACLHACQYALPHEFGVNLPRAMARVRVQTYADYAWPAPLGALYRRNGLAVSLALAGALALFLVLAVAFQGGLWSPPLGGNFYAIFPHDLMVSLFAPIFLFSVLALAMGARRYWKDLAPGAASGPAVAEASHDALRLKYLDGGHGQGCHDEDDAYTLRRRRFHHLTFYGFMLCFASTSVATLYHYLFGWAAPYAYTSLPKLLGVVGGVALVAGTLGLLWLNLRRDPAHGEASQRPMDRGFIALLLLAGLTGLLLTALRATPALGLLLAVHLGVVLALFATLPYGKFAHGVYRCAALLKWAIEKRQPSRLRLGDH
jgi:citrate/tricarballylate utilization protein